MSQDLRALIAERIATGIVRKSITNCARWAEKYRMMKDGPWTWKRHPWLKEMHESTAEFNVGQKAAQMGFTEWAMNTVFYSLDVKNWDCLYVLPSESSASEFSAGRFDPALELSPHLRKIFSNVNNVSLKRAGTATLYVRGSRSRDKLKSIPTPLIVFDEVEEMVQKNITLGLERASGQVERSILMISTPSIEGEGINKYHQLSTQEHFFFKCPSCSRLIELDFPQNLVITAESLNDPRIKESYFECHLCHKKLPHETKPEWLSTGRFVPKHADRDTRGFSVNQLYSSAQAGRPAELALAALKAQLDPTDEQEFYNSKLGKCHVVGDAKIEDTHIRDCTRGYRKGPTRGRIITMGVDVGAHWHVEIAEWLFPKDHTPGLDVNDEAIPRIIEEVSFPLADVNKLDKLMRRYGVMSCVMDRHPETYIAYQFATRHYGRVLLCMFGRGINGKRVQLGADDELTVTVDRTSWYDAALGRIINKRVEFPIDLSPEYKKHIKIPVRVYERDANGNPVGRYVSTDPSDHFASARVYNEIALQFAMRIAKPTNMGKVL